MSYIEKSKRKKILLLCDDIRMTSGIATMAKEIVIGTANHYNWVNLGGTIKHPEEGKRLDLSQDTNIHAEISDSSVVMYPVSGYGNPELVRHLIDIEKPDAIMIFTDPRYWIWLFSMEHEIRKHIPIIYLNIWDNLPYPRYNKSYYNSCDCLLAISKQTENINKVVLGDDAITKVIKYVPHGINEKLFEPVDLNDIKFKAFKQRLFGTAEYDFVIVFNSRNIYRKNIADLLMSYKLFIDQLSIAKAEKCAMVLHTQSRDENGTDLVAVIDMIFGNDSKYNIIFSEEKLPTDAMKYLYGVGDVTALMSSNEGWGLSLTESLMCGKMIIATVTGGMQDQMRFEDESGAWIEFNEEFSSNHRGKYKHCGEWAIPVFPSTTTIQGSIPTPYIYDDKVTFEDTSKALMECYNLTKKEREQRGQKGRDWVKSDEARMSARAMCQNIIEGIDQLFDTWIPRNKFELTQIETRKEPRHFNKYAISR